MKGIELEEGEAYFAQDDDDEKIDPDKDFSYIDKKIENVLGHNRKDFMGEPCPEILGARYGEYGSFLPMQQRSPPILSNARAQNHISLKSPQPLSSERSHQNPTTAVDPSLSVKPGLDSSDNCKQALTEPGTSAKNYQVKLQGTAEFASSNQQKELMTHHPERKLLKFRVKMSSENVSHDISAIYSGLGLDISPSSSLEDSPSDYDDFSLGLQEMTPETPSNIIKIMTTFPLPTGELLSPLHHNLVHLMGVENNLGTAVPDFFQTSLGDNSHGNSFMKGKIEATEQRKSKVKDSSSDRKSKQKDPSKERKLEKEVRNAKPAELVKKDQTAALPANRKEGGGTSRAEMIVISKAANAGVNVPSKETEIANLTDKSAGSKPSILFDVKSEVGCSEEDNCNSVQQVWVTGNKVKGESSLASSFDAAVEDVNTLRGKTEMSKNAISGMKRESSVEKRNEVACGDDEDNKLWKQQSVSKDKVKDEFLNSMQLKQDRVKDNGMREKTSKDKQVDLFSMNGTDRSVKHEDIYEMKGYQVETIEPSKQKTLSKVTPRSQKGSGIPSGKEHPSSISKKKPRESRIHGTCIEEPPRESVVVGSSIAESEGIVKHNIPSKARGAEIDEQRETRKDNYVTGNVYPGKKGKDVSLENFGMGVSVRETQESTSNQKDKSNSKKYGVATNIGSNMEGDMVGGNSVMEKVVATDLPPAEIVPHDDWVQCDKCQKWRLLPLGTDPDSLPKEWICSMLTWLPGKNKCSVSEDETNVRYQPLVPTQFPGNLQVYPVGSAFAGTSGVVQHAGLPGRSSDIDAFACGGNRRNLLNSEIDAARRSSIPEDIPVKKDQKHFSEFSNSRNRKNLSCESNAVRKSGDGKSSRFGKKRETDFDVSAVPKKMKRAHQQSMENPSLVGLGTVKTKHENQNKYPGALRITQDFAKRGSKSSLVEVKSSTPNAMYAKDSGSKDFSGRKRKLKDRQENITCIEEQSARVQPSLKNCSIGKNHVSEPREENRERNSKPSKIQGIECSTGMGNVKTYSDGGKHNRDSNRHKRGRSDKICLEERHADRVLKKMADDRNSCEKDLGLSDNATTSSSSKVSCKLKRKASEIKCSPVGSISSSPHRVSKSGSDKGTNRMPSLCKEHDDLFPGNQLKSRAQGALSEFAAHFGEMKDRKSKLSRNSGAAFNADITDHSFGKTSAGKRLDAHVTDIQTNIEDSKRDCLNLDTIVCEGGPLISHQNLVSRTLVAKSVNRLHFDETSGKEGTSHVPQIGSENEPSCNFYDVPETELVNGSDVMNVDNVDVKLYREVENDHGCLRHPLSSVHISDVEASSSIKKDSSHWDAKTTLKEARFLRNSADRLKISGSRLESIKVFFQAALKFLHGASLLEPVNSGHDRCGEMESTEVYRSTATLCEYCAREYEKHNDLASAALAYKCMEVAYMRVVYCKDLGACRDRMELQMAVRTAPQVESPSSSASDVDNLNNQAATEIVKDGQPVVDHRIHIIAAGNMPNFVRLMNFTEDINRAMEASRRSQSAFAAASPILAQARNEKGISVIKNVLDFSFHDVAGLLHLVRLAMESITDQQSCEDYKPKCGR